MRERVIALPKAYGRYGYRTVTDRLRREGWDLGKDSVYTIWRHEGQQVPQNQPKRARLWRADGAYLRPAYRHHGWSHDFVADRTHAGRPVRILNIIDEYTRECLASVVARRIRAHDVLLIRADLFLIRGIPIHIRSDHGPEFIARTLRQWLNALQVAPLYIEPGSPWENGYVKSCNGKMREQFLNGELFYTRKEAQIMTERWRTHYNMVHPHSSLEGQPAAPETVQLAS